MVTRDGAGMIVERFGRELFFSFPRMEQEDRARETLASRLPVVRTPFDGLRLLARTIAESHPLAASGTTSDEIQAGIVHFSAHGPVWNHLRAPAARVASATDAEIRSLMTS
jgi:hypothetical protein